MENRDLDRYETKELARMRGGNGVQVPHFRVELVPPPATPAASPETGGLREYLGLFRRHGVFVLAVAAGCAGISYLITLPQRPVYRAETAIEIQHPNENFLNLKDFDPGFAAGSAESYVEAQVKILHGEELLDRTASKLRVQERPDMWRDVSLLSAWKNRLGLGRRSHTAPPRDEILANLKDALVVRSAPQSRIIDVQFESTDPHLAAEFANSIADELIDHNLESKLQSAGGTARALAGPLGEVKSSLQKSENELQAYAGATGLILDQKGGTAADENLRQVQAELGRAQADRAAKQSRYEIAAAAAPESLPDVLDYGPLRDTQARVTDLKRQHAELSSTFAPTYFKVKSLAAQITEMEGILKKEQSHILQRIYNEYQSAVGREKLLQQSYDQQAKVMSHQAAASVHYDTLKREVDTNRTLYDAMLQKIKEAGIASTVRASNIRVINRATAPARPFRPKPLWNAATGLLAGFFLATAFVLIRDQTDRTIREPGDAAAHLNVPELGAIPSSGSGFDGLALNVGARRSRLGRKKNSAGSGPAEWVRSGSRLAQSFRSALASLWFTDNERMRIFAVTSPNSGDGKSTVVSHLGVTMANAKRRVLLMDGDLRRPVLHRMFGVENRLGLAGILEETRPIDDYSFDELFQDTEVPELFILPGGSGTSNVASLRFHDRLIELMARIRVEFDVVLMDTPPAIEYADARILGGLADGVILVLRASRTSRNAAWVTVRRFQDDGATIAGTILNDWRCADSRYDLGDFRPIPGPSGRKPAVPFARWKPERKLTR